MSDHEGSQRSARADGEDSGVDYQQAGVDYESLDEGKRLAMSRALSTSPLLAARGGRAIDASRGQPAFVFELDGRSLAFVVEGLGTKSVIARQVLEGEGVNRFDAVAYDTVAAIVNDLCCVGALPLVVNAYFATGASDWYLRPDARGRARRGLARGVRATRAARGAEASRRRCPGSSPTRTSSLPAARSASLPPGVAPILGDELAAGR